MRYLLLGIISGLSGFVVFVFYGASLNLVTIIGIVVFVWLLDNFFGLVIKKAENRGKEK